MKSKFLLYGLPILIFTAMILSMASFTLLDAFVLDRPVWDTTVVSRPSSKPAQTSSGALSDDPIDSSTPTTDDTPATGDPSETSEAPVTEAPFTYPVSETWEYEDEHIKLLIEESTVTNQNGIDNVVFYIDLQLSDIHYLRAFINTDSRGRVSTTPVSSMAEKNDAFFAINGDYFSMRQSGFVMRNYVTYRQWAREADDPFSDDALVFLSDGTMLVVDESDTYYGDTPSIFGLPDDTYQVFAFGPRLVEFGDIMVSETDEVGQSAEANPRTAIGMIEPLHYKIVIAEGRLDRYDGKDGLTLYELATVMKSLGCDTAYNLDGGSSTTLYFDGEVLNETPSKERKISDCIYINGRSYWDEVEK